MSTKIDELFATLRGLVADQPRDLALAMAELRSVAAERDKLRIERDEAGVRADFADLAAKNRGEALERNCVQYAQKQQALIAERDKFKKAHAIAISAWDNARQSLRAAEQDLAETESINSDLRTVNARLVADLAAAMERLNHAESILMQ
jgi:vacuolar-type H+-ATPase subunit I/STV1